jgi:hypothetical protein
VSRSRIDEVRAAVEALPDWYLHDLAEEAGVVEELVVGEELTSPSVQIDMLPGGGVRVLATHDQVIGVGNGQVYIGCRGPSSVIEAVRAAGLPFDHRHGTGVVLHMLACLAVDGRFGATAIWRSRSHADELDEGMLAAVGP